MSDVASAIPDTIADNISNGRADVRILSVKKLTKTFYNHLKAANSVLSLIDPATEDASLKILSWSGFGSSCI